jgi:uncharacterized phage protein (TIGR01671 family)
MTTTQITRIWDRQERKFVKNQATLESETKWMINPFTGQAVKLVALVDGDYGSDKYIIEPESNFYAQGYQIVLGQRYVAVPYTGLKDKNDNKVYEGDIVKFEYFVGDHAWVDMDPEERKLQEAMINRSYRGKIVKAPDSNNLQIEVVSKGSVSLFPLSYAGGPKSEIIGNIFENSL